MPRWLFVLRTLRGLLTVTLLAQAVVLSVGLLIVFNDIRHRVAVRLQDRILEQNVRTAESLAKTVSGRALFMDAGNHLLAASYSHR